MRAAVLPTPPPEGVGSQSDKRVRVGVNLFHYRRMSICLTPPPPPPFRGRSTPSSSACFNVNHEPNTSIVGKLRPAPVSAHPPTDQTRKGPGHVHTETVRVPSSARRPRGIARSRHGESPAPLHRIASSVRRWPLENP